ncbi:glycosyltransferase [Bacillus sp. ISL-18]|uniref:glycosyltransferase family 2 protein n=1 Tax=Bacillus sp. ISL-18 TaxID=2819118 RepID=UPI001BEC43C4|nr:glycosyltransferase [Bacillus sp. ISL-18]MBT2657089.1 glycosyltransferase [Bacillus sp. ISL-18]
MNYKITIIIPVYNGERYLEECCSALSNQTLKEIEVIFVNDGSIDRTKEILDGISKDNENITVIHQENKGPGASRNVGIEVARGEYIGFVDVDDYPLPSMYEQMYNLANTNHADIVVCGYIEINGDNSSVKSLDFITGTIFQKQQIREKILKPILRKGGGLFASLFNKIYRLSWIRTHGLRIEEKRNYGEDWYFNQLALGRAKKITFIKEPLYKYMRVNPHSLTLSYRHDLFDLHLKSREFLKERMEDWGLISIEDQFMSNTRFLEKVLEASFNEMSSKNPSNIYKRFLSIKTMINNPEVQYAAKSSEKSFKTLLILNKLWFPLSLYSWYFANIKPVLYRTKIVLINIIKY